MESHSDNLEYVKFSAKELLANMDRKLDDHNRQHEASLESVRTELQSLSKQMMHLNSVMLEGFAARPTWRGISALAALVGTLIGVALGVF